MTDNFLEPRKILERFGLSEGMYVADLGSGSGFYSLVAAGMVGYGGKVFAVDVQKRMLEHLSEEARKRGIGNIEVIWGDLEKEGGTKMTRNSIDAVILSNVLFQTEEKEKLLKEVKRILKIGGRALIIDWSDSFGHMGPHPEHIFSKREAGELFEKNDFEFLESPAAGAHHYALIFRKKN